MKVEVVLWLELVTQVQVFAVWRIPRLPSLCARSGVCGSVVVYIELLCLKWT